MEVFLTVGDVARLIGKGPQRVRQLEQAGVLKAIRTVSGMRLFAREEVEEFLASQRLETQHLETRKQIEPGKKIGQI